MIEKFAGYGFNKSHSTAYALIAYMTAYLKAHYPVEFMAALLVERHPGPQLQEEGLAGRAHGGLPADGHRGGAARREPLAEPTSPSATARFSSACRRSRAAAAARPRPSTASAGQGAVSEPVRFLRAARSRHGQPHRHRKRSSRPARSTRSARGGRSCSPRSIGRCSPARRPRPTGAAGRKGLFGDDEEDEPAGRRRPICPMCPNGTNATGSPRRRRCSASICRATRWPSTSDALTSYCSHTTAEAAELPHRTEVMLGGMLASIKISHTKNPKPGKPSKYAMFDLEDKDGIMRTIIWPEQFAQYGELVQPDAILVVRGAIDKRPGSEEANLIVNEVIPLDDLEKRYSRGVKIRIDRAAARGKGARTAPRNPPRLPGQLRGATVALPDRRAVGLVQVRRAPRGDQRRDARSRRSTSRAGQLPRVDRTPSVGCSRRKGQRTVAWTLRWLRRRLGSSCRVGGSPTMR